MEILKLILTTFLALVHFTTTHAQCPITDSVSFEKTVNVHVQGAILQFLYTGHGNTPISAECNNRCRASPNCNGFLINYNTHSCFSLGQEWDKQALTLVPTAKRTSFFEKICLSVSPCEKAWTFERVIGRELKGFDNRVIVGVKSRLHCQEMCLAEKSFLCRSGEYDSLIKECRLSMEDRRTQPTAFIPTTLSVDYFENQCSPSTVSPDIEQNKSGLVPQSPTCDYQKHENLEIQRPDLLRTAFSVDQCRSVCESTKAFTCRSFTFKPATSFCWLSSDDSFSIGGIQNLVESPGTIYYERSSCLNLKLDCTPDAMLVTLNTLEPFEGKIYAKDDAIACENSGRKRTTTSLLLPIKGVRKCGVREEIRGRYSALVIVQYHPVIQRSGDRQVKLICNVDAPEAIVTNSYRIVQGGNDLLGSATVNATAPTPKIKLRITDADGLDIVGARLGEELFLQIEMENDSAFDIFAKDLVASSGANDDSIVLLDSNGCPTDTSIFPALKKVPGAKILRGKFDAFKFADDVVVRFQVNVQFCASDCVSANCQENPEGETKRTKRAIEGNITQVTVTMNTLLPDYPLKREIIVEGFRTDNSIQREAFVSKNPSSTMYCTSRTTLLALFISTLILEASVLSVCCSCILFYKCRNPYNRFKLDPNRTESQSNLNEERTSPRIWSSLSHME